jgi:hypothetical protein
MLIALPIAYLLAFAAWSEHQVLNDTDWSDQPWGSRVSDDKVLPHADNLTACVSLCKAREDCVAVSWSSPAGPQIDQGICSLKCSAFDAQRVHSQGHFAVIVRNKTACPAASWFPKEWKHGIDTGSLLLAGPKQQGAHIGNGYVAAWIKSLVGSQGPVQSGVEHVVGVFAGRNTKTKPAGCVSWCDRAHKADLPSFTSTATIASLGGEELPGTASAMDLQRGAYLRASATHDRTARCVQTSYAHRTLKHILVTEFRCTNDQSTPVTVALAEPGPNPIAAPTAELSNASVSSGLVGVTCSKMQVLVGETDGSPRATISECHSVCSGVRYFLPPKAKDHLHSCISSRHTTVDDLGPPLSSTVPADADPTPLAINSWIAANDSRASLFDTHTAAMTEVLRPGELTAPSASSADSSPVQTLF